MPKALTPEQQKLVEQNLGLVRSQVGNFVRLKLLSRDELYSEGCLALVYAAEAWKAQGKFSTYAVTAIRRQFFKAMLHAKKKQLTQEPWCDRDDESELNRVPGRDGDPADMVAAGDSNSILGELARLPEQERAALCLHFGLDGRDPVKVCDLGKRLGGVSERAACKCIQD